MLQDLEFLIQVQEIDGRIHEQEISKELLPAQVAVLEDNLEKINKAKDAADAKLLSVQNEITAIEDQVKQANLGLEKSQERLNSIKTNREYDAVHAEIENHKITITSAETRMKKTVDQIEQLKTAAQAAQDEYEKTKTEYEPQIAELKTRIASIDSVIAEIMKERNTVTPSISKSLMRTYDQISRTRKNKKTVSIVTRKRTCTVCFKMLEPRLINEIKRAVKLTMCQNCGSILIWQDDLDAGNPGYLG